MKSLVKKVNAEKIDLAIIMTRNLYLTAQNIVIAFQISEGSRWLKGKYRMGNSLYLLDIQTEYENGP